MRKTPSAQRADGVKGEEDAVKKTAVILLLHNQKIKTMKST